MACVEKKKQLIYFSHTNECNVIKQGSLLLHNYSASKSNAFSHDVTKYRACFVHNPNIT